MSLQVMATDCKYRYIEVCLVHYCFNKTAYCSCTICLWMVVGVLVMYLISVYVSLCSANVLYVCACVCGLLMYCMSVYVSLWCANVLYDVYISLCSLMYYVLVFLC